MVLLEALPEGLIPFGRDGLYGLLLAHVARWLRLPYRRPRRRDPGGGTGAEAMDTGPGVEELALRVRRLDPSVPLPSYAHPGDAGLDLCAAESRKLAPGERAAVSTGLAVAIPDGWVGLVHPRSGLALRAGLTVVNAPGTIDSGYRGELKVLLVNLGGDPVQIERGDRVAQLLLQRVARAVVVESDSLDDTTRGAGGFGSTGVAHRPEQSD